ncbi:hypothetical protein ACPF8X_43045, partial [Streptomyces sp. G35A]
ADEAVTLARRLVRDDRVAHRALLAHALASHGSVLAHRDRDRAVASLREAAALYERLVLVDSGHETQLDTVMANLRTLGGTDRPRPPAAADAETVARFNAGVRSARAGRTAEAEEHYLRAAGAGLPHAMFNLGHLYRELDRTADAAAWWRRAVDAGMTAACHDLGLLHWRRGDRDTARYWFGRGAEAGATNAMVALGAVAWDGGDLAEAERRFRAAADGGDAEGDHRLALLLA